MFTSTQERQLDFLRTVAPEPKVAKIVSAWGLELAAHAADVGCRVLERVVLQLGGGVTKHVAESVNWARSAASGPCLNGVCMDNCKKVEDWQSFLRLPSARSAPAATTTARPAASTAAARARC